MDLAGTMQNKEFTMCRDLGVSNKYFGTAYAHNEPYSVLHVGLNYISPSKATKLQYVIHGEKIIFLFVNSRAKNIVFAKQA